VTYPCGVCGWPCKPREYHPLVACWVVKANGGRDPMPYMNQIAADMEYVNDKGEFRLAEEKVTA
jgi:hypothetical protein